MDTNENESPLKRLVEAGNDLIAQGLQLTERDNPVEHAKAMAFARAGAAHRLTIETRAEKATIAFDLVGADGGLVSLFRFDLKHVTNARH